MLTRDIMTLLDANPAGLHSWEIIEKLPGEVDKQIVWSTLNRLKNEGVIIQDKTTRVYLKASTEVKATQDGKAVVFLAFLNAFFTSDKVTDLFLSGDNPIAASKARKAIGDFIESNGDTFAEIGKILEGFELPEKLKEALQLVR